MLRQSFGVLLLATSWVNCFRVPKYQSYFAAGNIYLPNRMALLSSPYPISESANRIFELGDWSVNAAKGLADIIFNKSEMPNSDGYENRSSSSAVDVMEEMNINLLEDVASRTPQLTTVELAVLLTTISLSALSPFFLDIEVIEVLVPSLAALSASVGISAEYIGKIAVSNGKEFAALAIIAAAEAESILAAAERSKSALPICVGLAAMASIFALVAPLLLKEIGDQCKIRIFKEVYLICPVIAIFAAAVAGLAMNESQGLASRAISSSGGKQTAYSPLMMFLIKADKMGLIIEESDQKWKLLAQRMAPPAIIAALFPGNLSTKSIVCAAVAAAQSAYYLAAAEYYISLATDAVALKARSAAVSDFYANQSSRASAILPFTSALAGFCAAASAAAVELLPFVSTVEQAVVALIFPSGAALFAAAAAVSKARCEVRISSPYTFDSQNFLISSSV